MNIRKFIGATSRDAFRLVREALGPDAVVLSNRVIEDGSVEIVAVADGDLAKISPKAAAEHREMKLKASTGNQSHAQSFAVSFAVSFEFECGFEPLRQRRCLFVGVRRQSRTAG
jgi:flagellar biosynthesis protein FlhF